MYFANALFAIGVMANACLHGCCAWTAELNDDTVYQRNMSTLAFLKHVLMNESAWKRILDERVRGLERPMYADVFAAHGVEIVPQALFVDGMEFNTRSIIVNVVNDFDKVGSFVKYAAAVLQKSFLCFTAKHLAFQTHYMTLLLRKDPSLGATLVFEANVLKENLVTIVDKLVITPTDLSLVLEAYWDMVMIMQYDTVLHVRNQAVPQTAEKTVDGLYKKFVDYRKANCSEFKLDLEFFDDINVEVDNKMIVENLLDATLNVDELLKVGREHSKFLTTFYRDLKYNMMLTRMWTQVFYSSKRVMPNDELDETNHPINQQVADGTVES